MRIGGGRHPKAVSDGTARGCNYWLALQLAPKMLNWHPSLVAIGIRDFGIRDGFGTQVVAIGIRDAKLASEIGIRVVSSLALGLEFLSCSTPVHFIL